MRSFPRQEVVKFRNGVLGVPDPPPVSGPLLAVDAAREGLHRAAPHLLDLPRPAFLDSSLIDDHGGRYSVFTADLFLVSRSRGRRVELTGPAGRAVTEENPWTLLHLLLRRYPVDRAAGLPPFLGGAVGYFGYDLGRTLERLPATAAAAAAAAAADEGLPELDLGFYDWVLAAELAPRVGLEVVERAVRSEGLRVADEVFLTNALMGFVPLTEVDALPIGTGIPGPVSLRLRAELERLESFSSGFSFLLAD
jgi:hypothetical protein